MAKLSYKLTREAKNDLIAMGSYTFRKWGENKAKEYHYKIQQQFESLLSNPEKGRVRYDLGNGCRTIPIAKHIIIYRINGSNIEILRILHQSMDVENYLEDDS